MKQLRQQITHAKSLNNMMNSLELEKDNIIKGVKNLLRFKK